MPTKIKVMFFAVLLTVFVSVHADAAVLTIGNVSKPIYPGQLLSFDLLVSDPADLTATAFQATLHVDTPGLTFRSDFSENVTSDSDYWIYNNSAGIWAQQLETDTFRVSDSPDSPSSEMLITDDIVARYVFTWNGSEEIYTFTLDLDTTQSYFLLPDITYQALQFDPGQLPGGEDYFSINLIPEPATLALLALGGIMLRRKKA